MKKKLSDMHFVVGEIYVYFYVFTYRCIFCTFGIFK